MYHFRFSLDELKNMTDDDWASWYSILENIRTEQAKQQPFTML